MNYGPIAQSYEDVVVKAESEGKKVIVADDYTLQIDIDTEEDYKKWQEAKELLLPLLPNNTMVHYEVVPSASGGSHRHITMHLVEPMDVWKRIALQFCFGSHWKREVLDSYRVITGNNECPIVFFEQGEVKFEGRRIVLE
jgi:hypothetical protein